MAMGKQIGALGVVCAIAAGVCCAVLLIGGHGRHASLLWPGAQGQLVKLSVDPALLPGADPVEGR